MNNLFICNYFIHPVKLQMRIVSPSPKGKKKNQGVKMFVLSLS